MMKGTRTVEGGAVSKSISMPPELWNAVEARIQSDPELDFSSYARRLMRRDLETARNAEAEAMAQASPFPNGRWSGGAARGGKRS